MNFHLFAARHFGMLTLCAFALLFAAPCVHAQTNLVVNGDFSLGTTGFSSDYTLEPSNGTVRTVPGEFGITTNPNTGFTNGYGSFGDHTTGTGNMLLADGAGNSGDRIWYETLTLATNTVYSVSYWGASVDSVSPAVLNFFVGSTQVGSSLALTPTVGLFQQATGSFNSGAGGNVTVAIRDANTDAIDNDFVIDDIKVSGVAAAPEPADLALLISAALPIAVCVVRRRWCSR